MHDPDFRKEAMKAAEDLAFFCQKLGIYVSGTPEEIVNQIEQDEYYASTKHQYD
jgi:hypothetical protein